MPSTATHRLQGLTTSVAVKPPCVVAALSSITLAGLQTIEGVAVAEGDRVLVTAQSNAVDNGIYIASTGTWSRAKDADGALDLVSGTLVIANNQIDSGIYYQLNTPDPIVIGTTALDFDPVLSGLTQSIIGQLLYPQSEAESDASVIPTDYAGSSRPWIDAKVRYGLVGDGVTDDTAAFTRMLAVGGQIFLARGDYLIDGHFLFQSNTTLLLEPGTILRDAGNLDADESMFYIYSLSPTVWVENVHIIGWGAKIVMDRADYTTGEQRHGLNIFGRVRNICVEGLRSDSCGGDGFLVHCYSADAIPEDVLLYRCLADNNRRQGLSITSGRRITVLGGTYSGTTGTEPQYGIDIEPDDSTGELEGIKIIGVTTKNNAGGGILCALSAFVATAEKTVDILIDGWTSVNDGSVAIDAGLRITGNVQGAWANKMHGQVVCKNSKIINPGASGVWIGNWPAAQAPIAKVHDVEVINPNFLGQSSEIDKCGLILFQGPGSSAEFGNVDCRRVITKDTRGVVATYVAAYIYSVVADGWSNLYLEDCYGDGFYGTAGSSRHVLQSSVVKNSRIVFTNEIARKLVTAAGVALVNHSGRDVVTSASAVHTLPAAETVIGQEFTVSLSANATVQIDPPTGDTIFYNGLAANTDFILRKKWDTITLRAVAATEWAVVKVVSQTDVSSGAPSYNASFIGQFYLDASGNKLYVSKAVGTGASDWVILN